jgi:glycosyltransferase involved in cell wall biosynthesis
MSRALLEALACAIPAVVTDVGDHRDIVEGGACGLVSPTRDAPALADALVQLSRDGDLRSSCGQAATRLARKQFDLRLMTARYTRFYTELASERRLGEYACAASPV